MGPYLFVSIRFQVYFTALIGLLFTFPSRYLFTIGLERYLALPVSSGGFPQAIRVLWYSRTKTRKIVCFRVRDYHPLGCFFPEASTNKRFCNFPPDKSRHLCLTTAFRSCEQNTLGFCAFARRY